MGAVEKAAGTFIVLVILLILAIIGLLGWGFVEIIQWVTSK